MKLLRRFSFDILFVLHVLLLFFLVFEKNLSIPTFLQPLGRMHPLLLHLPIGFLILLAFVPLLKKEIEAEALRTIQSLTLYLAALSAAFAALMGLFLAQEGGYDNDTIWLHKYLGIGVSFLTYGLLWVHENYFPLSRGWYYLFYLNIVLLVGAGHFGGELTHGAGYVTAPLKSKEATTAESTVYQALIEPILAEKCMGCHNKRKAKGELLMTTPEHILAGGENGPILQAGDPANSKLLQRVHLPLTDEEHMPPEGKAQLTAGEIERLHQWIKAGADFTTTLETLEEGHPLQAFINVSPSKANQQKYTFEAADPKLVERLNGPFRTVQPVAQNSAGLQAAVFVRQFYEPAFLAQLLEIQEQLVRLNLTNLPIEDDDLNLIAQFPNLEKLILNGTAITGGNLEVLQACSQLKSLALSNTTLTQDISPALQQLPALEELFIWNTSLAEDQVLALQKKLPAVKINQGYPPDQEEILQLSPPGVKNKNTLIAADDSVKLVSRLPGAEIRFTTDGSEPDSLASPIYHAPFPIDTLTLVKAKVFKPGWLTSEAVSMRFFPGGIVPKEAILLSQPMPTKAAKGGKSLIDQQKGKAKNMHGGHWMGFSGNPLEAEFDMGDPVPAVKTIMVSYLRDIGGSVFPPTSIELWGGPTREELALLEQQELDRLTGVLPNEVVTIPIAIQKDNCRYYKLKLTPLDKTPKWHWWPGGKASLFVDEVLFY